MTLKNVRSAALFVLLAVFYFGLIMPISLAVRAITDPLKRNPTPDSHTYLVVSRAARQPSGVLEI